MFSAYPSTAPGYPPARRYSLNFILAIAAAAGWLHPAGPRQWRAGGWSGVVPGNRVFTSTKIDRPVCDAETRLVDLFAAAGLLALSLRPWSRPCRISEAHGGHGAGKSKIDYRIVRGGRDVDYTCIERTCKVLRG